jgi:hypothetical protein
MSSIAPSSIIPDTASERRIAPRRQPALGTVCRLDTAAGPSALALVWNISATGVSVLVAEPRTTGTVLTGTLERMEGDQMIRIAMRVVHAKKLETGDYVLGAHFDRRLTEDELSSFVSEV